jgi:RimJ/RimL family protein N-acetyltransferase
VLLDVNEQLRLTPLRPTDEAALVLHLQERQIYQQTLRVPFPYTEADARWWIAEATRQNEKAGKVIHFAIRDPADSLIGCCGLDSLADGPSHRAAIGYWLAKPYWGRGIMTAVIGRLCRLAFEDYGLVKLTADVFANNQASARVLEKCEFVQEGYMRKHYRKDGAYFDARVFGRVK